MLLNPFYPLSTAKVLALKAAVQITAGSALGFSLLLLQALVFLAIGGGLVVATGGAALYASQQRRPVAA